MHIKKNQLIISELYSYYILIMNIVLAELLLNLKLITMIVPKMTSNSKIKFMKIRNVQDTANQVVWTLLDLRKKT